MSIKIFIFYILSVIAMKESLLISSPFVLEIERKNEVKNICLDDVFLSKYPLIVQEMLQKGLFQEAIWYLEENLLSQNIEILKKMLEDIMKTKIIKYRNKSQNITKGN